LLTDILQKINAIGGLVEKSKLFGCNFISMVINNIFSFKEEVNLK
jgi:hypothetical protein